MIARSLKVRKIRFNIKPIIILILLLAGCQPGQTGECSGCITIAQNDSSPPALSIRADQENGKTVGVTVGESPGSELKMTLATKTGKLYLTASAHDPESGVQALEIWVTKAITSCDANGLCSLEKPVLADKPTFESTSSQQMPGELTPASSIMIQWLELSKEIDASIPAGESLRVDFIIHAVAVNHLGGRTQTPDITVTWKEP